MRRTAFQRCIFSSMIAWQLRLGILLIGFCLKRKSGLAWVRVQLGEAAVVCLGINDCVPTETWQNTKSMALYFPLKTDATMELCLLFL